MKKVFALISCCTLLFVQCTQTTTTTKTNQSNVAYCRVTYMNLGNTFYIPRTPSNFYQTKDLYYLTIRGSDTCEKFNEYLIILKANAKAEYQNDPIDPRFAIKVKYKDSTEKSVFIDVGGYYMLDTIGTIYTVNIDFLKYIKNVVNDNTIVEWELWTQPH